MEIDNKILELLKRRYNLPKEIITEIVGYQFKYVAEHIKNQRTQDVLIHNLGRFKLIKKRLKYYPDHGKTFQDDSNDSGRES